MAQSNRLEEISVAKSAEQRPSIEIAGKIIAQLSVFLKEYQIMPESFILPVDYPKGEFVGGKFQMSLAEEGKQERLDALKQNKLRTTWFNVVISGLKKASVQFDIDLPSLAKQESEFRELLNQEDLRAKEILNQKIAGKKISPEESLVVYKEARREASKELIAEKIRLIYGFDALLKQTIKKLKQVSYGE